MKIVYAGTPSFAVAPLRSILESGYEVVAVITQQDKPAGRKGVLTPPPVKTFALGHGIPVLQPARIRDEADKVRSLGADLMVTCAFGQILSQEILDIFPLGVWNIHASLLPKYRGAAPVQWAVVNGETHTGVTVMKTDEGLDTGDVLLSRPLSLDGTETAGTLSQKLSALGGECIADALALLEKGEAPLTPQAGEATLCKKIKKEQCLLDFSRPAEELSRLVRAMNPQPLAWSLLRGAPVNFYYALPEEGEGAPGQIVRADKTGIYIAAGGGVLRVTELQFAGGRPVRAADAVNGRKVCAGDVFGA